MQLFITSRFVKILEKEIHDIQKFEHFSLIQNKPELSSCSVCGPSSMDFFLFTYFWDTLYVVPEFLGTNFQCR